MRHVTHIRWLEASDYASVVVIADEDGAGVPPAIDALRERSGPRRAAPTVRPSVAAPVRRGRASLALVL